MNLKILLFLFIKESYSRILILRTNNSPPGLFLTVPEWYHELRPLLCKPVRHLISTVHPITMELLDKLKTFPPYLRLPIELRLMIWEHAVADISPCRYELRWMYVPKKLDQGCNIKEQHQFLRTCHDSRISYLKSYTPWGAYIAEKISTRTSPVADLQQGFSYAYVNFDKDIFKVRLTGCEPHTSRTRVVVVYDFQGPRPRRQWYSVEGDGVGRIRQASTVNLAKWPKSPWRRYRSNVSITEKEFLTVVLGQESETQ